MTDFRTRPNETSDMGGTYCSMTLLWQTCLLRIRCFGPWLWFIGRRMATTKFVSSNGRGRLIWLVCLCYQSPDISNHYTNYYIVPQGIVPQSSRIEMGRRRTAQPQLHNQIIFLRSDLYACYYTSLEWIALRRELIRGSPKLQLSSVPSTAKMS